MKAKFSNMGAFGGIARPMSMRCRVFALALVVKILLTLMSMRADAAEVARPGFTNMTQAVDFLVQCVHRDDVAAFTNACVRPLNSTQDHTNVFADLQRLDAARPLKEIYAGREFPTNTDSFLMGGHNSELGYINIPLLKTNGMWFIQDYFHCR
jgi:hypothetical protein